MQSEKKGEKERREKDGRKDENRDRQERKAKTCKKEQKIGNNEASKKGENK